MTDRDLFILIGGGYAIVAALVLGWAGWRLRRPFKPLDTRPRLVHALPDAVLAALGVWWILTGEGAIVILGYIGFSLSVIAMILRVRAVRGRDGGSA